MFPLALVRRARSALRHARATRFDRSIGVPRRATRTRYTMLVLVAMCGVGCRRPPQPSGTFFGAAAADNVAQLGAHRYWNQVAIDTVNEDGVTALCLAVSASATNAVAYLLQHGADPNYPCGKGPRRFRFPPLERAIASLPDDTDPLVVAHIIDMLLARHASAYSMYDEPLLMNFWRELTAGVIVNRQIGPVTDAIRFPASPLDSVTAHVLMRLARADIDAAGQVYCRLLKPDEMPSSPEERAQDQETTFMLDALAPLVAGHASCPVATHPASRPAATATIRVTNPPAALALHGGPVPTLPRLTDKARQNFLWMPQHFRSAPDTSVRLTLRHDGTFTFLVGADSLSGNYRMIMADDGTGLGALDLYPAGHPPAQVLVLGGKDMSIDVYRPNYAPVTLYSR